jgi:hypothetical protein
MLQLQNKEWMTTVAALAATATPSSFCACCPVVPVGRDSLSFLHLLFSNYSLPPSCSAAMAWLTIEGPQEEAYAAELSLWRCALGIPVEIRPTRGATLAEELLHLWSTPHLCISSRKPPRRHRSLAPSPSPLPETLCHVCRVGPCSSTTRLQPLTRRESSHR